MKLIFVVAAIAAIIIIFLWLCKKIDPSFTIDGLLDRLTGTKPVAQPVAPPALYSNGKTLFQAFAADYGNFTSLIWNCLILIASKCNLSLTNHPWDIYASEIAERVALNGGTVIFRYDVSQTEPLYGGGMKQVPQASASELCETLERNLPDFMTDGYYFSGKVSVWPIGKGRFRIEVHGVNRSPIIYTGDLII